MAGCRTIRVCGAAALVACALQASAGAQHKRARVAQVERGPRIDGVLDDAVWGAAAPIGPLTQIEPREGVPPSFATEVRLVRDEQALYIGIRCFDPEPDKILVTSLGRDAFNRVDDRIELLFDTFDDGRNAFYFEVNAGGGRGDAIITDNGAGFNRPWDGIWEARTRIDDEGWVAELALPFDTFAFAEGGDAWGFNAERHIGRLREVCRWASPNRDARLRSVAHAGRLEGLAGARQGLGLDVVPFGVVTWDEDREAGSSDTNGDAGLDVFYKLTSGLTLSATVNTDFAETEVDERRINLTRFPLFFPERRDFFLQDAGLFDFPSNGVIPFFSRRIGLGPDGVEVPIRTGVKLSGRAGPWSIGLLDVQTGAADEAPDENHFAARISHDVGESSSVGVLVTRGAPSGEGVMSTYGADARYVNTTFLGDKTLNANAWVLASDDEASGSSGSAWGGALVYPNDVWSAFAAVNTLGEDFDPGLGFISRPGVSRYVGGVTHEPRVNDAIRSLEFSLDGSYIENSNGRFETSSVEAQPIGVLWESGDSARIELEVERDRLDGSFEIVDDVLVPAGTYETLRWRFEAQSSETRPVFGEFTVSGGEFFDGERDELEFGVGWRPGPRFTGSLEFEVNDVRLPDGDFTTHLARLRADISFSPDLAWNNFVQWDDVSQTYGLFSRVRWILEPGQELFFVLNETLAEDELDDPLLQGLALKVVYTLRF